MMTQARDTRRAARPRPVGRPDQDVPKVQRHEQAGCHASGAGVGQLRSPVVIVGQSLCESCMAAQEPFVGGSDSLEAGFDLADIKKENLYITNVVHCHPANNVKSRREWKMNCTPYLGEELRLVQPKLIIGLGDDAKAAISGFYHRALIMQWPFRTPRRCAVR